MSAAWSVAGCAASSDFPRVDASIDAAEHDAAEHDAQLPDSGAPLPTCAAPSVLIRAPGASPISLAVSRGRHAVLWGTGTFGDPTRYLALVDRDAGLVEDSRDATPNAVEVVGLDDGFVVVAHDALQVVDLEGQPRGPLLALPEDWFVDSTSPMHAEGQRLFFFGVPPGGTLRGPHVIFELDAGVPEPALVQRTEELAPGELRAISSERRLQYFADPGERVEVHAWDVEGQSRLLHEVAWPAGSYALSAQRDTHSPSWLLFGRRQEPGRPLVMELMSVDDEGRSVASGEYEPAIGQVAAIDIVPGANAIAVSLVPVGGPEAVWWIPRDAGESVIATVPTLRGLKHAWNDEIGGFSMIGRVISPTSEEEIAFRCALTVERVREEAGRAN